MKTSKPFAITSKQYTTIYHQVSILTDFGRSDVVSDRKGKKYRITSENRSMVAAKILGVNLYA